MQVPEALRPGRLVRLRASLLPPPLGENDLKPRFTMTGHSIEVPPSEGPSPESAPTPPGDTRVVFQVDELDWDAGRRRLVVLGWAAPSAVPILRRDLQLLLVKDGRAWSFPTDPVGRPDVAAALGPPWAADAGFAAVVDTTGLPAGTYGLGLLFERPRRAALRTAADELRGRQPRARTRRPVRTLEELDRELDVLTEIAPVDLKRFRVQGESMELYEDVASLPADPDSDEYRDRQMALYRRIARLDEHDPWASESREVEPITNVESYAYPYRSKTPEHIGNHYLAVGHILRTLATVAPPGSGILEYGCGEGFTTVAMASSGYHVTAVDVDKQAIAVVDELVANRDVSVLTLNGVFGEVPTEHPPYHVALFYESFHHCLEFRDLIRRLDDLLEPGGAIVFAGEPISADFPKPWGLRPDASALWEVRRNGWLELGFREDYFTSMLDRLGWTVEKRTAAESPDIYVARRKA